jgi:hypothetical protein
MVHTHRRCYMLGYDVVAAECFHTTPTTMRTEVYICPICGVTWGSVDHECLNFKYPCLRRFAGVTKTCPKHGGGSLLDMWAIRVAADSILEEIPRNLILHELRVWNHA